MISNTSTVKKHPEIPFINVGTVADIETYLGYSGVVKNEPNKKLWTFTIGGNVVLPLVYASEDDALRHAEECLFTMFSCKVDEMIDRVLEMNDIRTALKIAEKRGYWQGISEEKLKLSEKINPIIAQLQKIDI